jgi:hypothetical protein
MKHTTTKRSFLAVTAALVFALATLSTAGCATGGFKIEGKWKNTETEMGIGQAQPGAIVAFDGTNCNFISPSDTYVFYEDDPYYRLDWTTVLGGSGSNRVEVIDDDNILIHNGEDSYITMTRVG